MACAFDIDAYTCNTRPKPLWRVAHSGSQSRRDSGTGDIIASESTRTLYNTTDLKKAAEDHFDWYCRRRSCFLSVFSCEEHAFNWAKQRQDPSSTDDVHIHEIDTTKLPRDARVFDASSLITKLGITHKPSDNELLFLHRIPSESIKGSRSVSEVEYGDGEARVNISHVPVTGPDSFDEVAINACPALRAAPRRDTQYGEECRPWKRALSFSNNKGRTKVICVENVYVLKKISREDGSVPKKNGAKGSGSYGVDFVTISIPGYVRSRLAAAIHDVYPDCNLDDKRFERNENRWFKAINNVKSILSTATPNPDSNAEPCVESHRVGEVLSMVDHAVEIRAYLEIAVVVKASAAGGAGIHGSIDETGMGDKTVRVTAILGLVTNLHTGDVDMPQFVRSPSHRASPREPGPGDYASEDVLENFRDLGLDD